MEVLLCICCPHFIAASLRKRAAEQSTSDLRREEQQEVGGDQRLVARSSSDIGLQTILPYNKLSDKVPFKCDNCDGKYTNHPALLDHIENCDPIICRYCPKIACDYERLKVHVSWSHDSLISQCRYCLHISYGDTADIKAHRKKLCPMQGGFACEHCLEAFKSFAALNSHACNQIIKLWNPCSYCSFRTYSVERLRLHYDTHFNEEVLFRCPACAWGSDSYGRVRRHIHQYHHSKAAIVVHLTNMKCLWCSYLWCSDKLPWRHS